MFLKTFRKQSFFAVALSICLMMNFTYTAFAVDDFPQGFVPPSWVDNGETYMGIFDLTNFSSEEKEMFSNHIKSPNSLYWLSYNTGGRNQFIRFYIVEDGVTISGFSDNVSNFQFVKNGIQVRCPYFEFILHGSQNSKPVSERIWIPQGTSSGYLMGIDSTVIAWFELYPRTLVSVGSYYAGSVFIGGYFLSDNSLIDSVSRCVEVNPLGDIHFLYIPVEQPPEPSPTPTPEPTLPPVDPPKPPDVTQPPIDYPTFPKIENIYVPYDTSIWNEFSHKIRSSIGSSTNVGFTLLAIILGIFVVLGIIRKFAGAGKGGN